MKFSASLDVDVLALESGREVTVLLDLSAPEAPSAERTPTALQVVLDRSGSMAGAPLEGAIAALNGVVAQLDPADVFGVVTFDDTAQVVVPAAVLADKEAATHKISAISARGCTDLSSGYLRGLQELRRGAKKAGVAGGTVLIISDGHVNRGITELDEFASITAKAAADGIVTSTLGYGRNYDETLLAAITRSGNGNHVFADNPDAAGGAIAGEVAGLLAKAAQAVTLTVRYVPAVRELSLYNDLPAHQTADGEVMIELGDLYSLESRKLLLRMQVDALTSLGAAQVAELELRYVETATLIEHTVTLPISVNVVPGDKAAGAIPDPRVQSEKLYQEGQAAKLRASEAFERGDADEANSHLGASNDSFRAAADLAAPSDRALIEAEIEENRSLRPAVGTIDAMYASKVSRAAYHRGNRKRGR